MATASQIATTLKTRALQVPDADSPAGYKGVRDELYTRAVVAVQMSKLLEPFAACLEAVYHQLHGSGASAGTIPRYWWDVLEYNVSAWKKVTTPTPTPTPKILH